MKKNKKILAILLALLLLFLSACSGSIDTSNEKSKQNEPIEQVEDNYVEYYFRSEKLLKQHYEKHGIEMGFSDKESYEKAASDVINNKDALSKKEAEDNDYVYYIESTNEFVVLSDDGYIRTYFLPDAGIRYYNKQ